MIEDMFFCVISIVVGGYLVSQKLRAIYNRLPLSLKDKISFGEGLILIISGFIALYVKSAIPINAFFWVFPTSENVSTRKVLECSSFYNRIHNAL